MAWVVVKFTQTEVEVVPYKWLEGENQCWWPPFKKTALEKSIKSCLEPSNDWELHSCTVMSKIFDKFSVATITATKAQYSSDIESSKETTLPERRKIKKNRKFIPSDSDEEEEEEEEKYMKGQRKSGEEEIEGRGAYSFPVLEKFKGLECMEHNNEKDINLQNAMQSSEKEKGLPVIRKSFLEHTSGQDITQINQMVSLLIKNNNLLKNLTQEMEETKHIVNDIALKLNGNVSQNAVSDISALIKMFPIRENEILEQVETQLSEEETFKAVVIKLSRTGGDTVRESVRRIMNNIVHYELAASFSWVGHKGKRNFSALRLAKAVIEAVELLHYVTQKDIEQNVAKWLAKAPERFKLTNNNNVDI